MPGALGHTLGSRPEVTVNNMPRTDIAFLNAERWTGGKKLDTATLEYRLHGPNGDLTGRFIDKSLYGETATKQIVRVYAPADYRTRGGEVSAPNAVSGKRLIHVGSVVSSQVRYDAGGPVYELVSQLKPCHFGQPLAGYPAAMGRGNHTDLTNYRGVLPAPESAVKEVVDAPERRDLAYTVIPEDIVFNPEVDGRIIGNRLRSNVGFLFVDPAQTKQEGNRVVHGLQRTDDPASALRWRLIDAVAFLCGWLNEDNGQGDSLVRNPSLEEILAAFGQAPIENVRIKLGTYLPDALDQLIQPLGFDWFTNLNHGQGPTISPYRRGYGTALGVHHQKPGSRLQASPLHAEGFSLQYDTSQTINAAAIFGAKRLYELTIQLIPAWDYELEQEIEGGAEWAKKLTKGSADWADDPRLAKLLRQFVANEGGSCIGNTVRTVGAGGSELKQKIQTAFDLPGFLGTGPHVFSVRNRRFLPTITANPDLTPIGPHGGVLIEVSDDAGETWWPLSDVSDVGAVTILDDEMGIRFDADWPPFISLILSGKFRIRVTASIESDDAITVGDEFTPSVAAERQAQVIDGSDRFFYRRVTQRSIYHAAVRSPDAAERLASTECDDTLKMLAQLELLESWNQAECDGRIPLPTLACPAELGMTVPRIGGLNLDLRTSLETGPAKGAPSIVGIGYDQQGQESVLFLNSYRGKVSL